MHLAPGLRRQARALIYHDGVATQHSFASGSVILQPKITYQDKIRNEIIAARTD